MIHAFTFDGTNIVLDVNSNAVHVVDEPAFNIIKEYAGATGGELVEKYAPVYGPDVVREILREVDELKNKGLLFSGDPLPGGYRPPEEGVVKALCLHLAHDCNLRCRYCFAGQGDFGGDRGLMSLEVGRAAIDFLMQTSGGRRHVEVDFFGGEPLLNRPVLFDLVQYGRFRAREAGKEIKFTLTTNALLLDREMQRFIGENDLAVVLSIDGRPGVHDRMRPFPSGEGSYRRVMERIKQFVHSPYCGEYYIRGTFTRYNLDFSEDVRHLAEAGFEHISVEPVVAGADTGYALRDEDVPVLLEEYEKLTRYLLGRHRQGRPVDFFHFNIDLEDGPCLPKRLTGCSAGLEYLAVTPGGDLYPCHQFVGRQDFRMGNVFEGLNSNPACFFREAHIYNKNACGQCWAKFHCSGGCHANALAFNGNLLEPYRLGCLLARKRLECALYLKVCTQK
ncbi:thioether cross-link-forming SCIFF peptide maturase [Desulfallas sp. Bu1-1]|uniref:thioether cross-link-forming SCIFF peptide maturase n=1 Tax=Desulfallas sp. Bu1-1 TaxID=2787620 RepID=UPI00189D9ADF|nr:thioether cross-link-forming SCIFF peptide maturase [Desulfallas sp. Bu1-1]MBF7081453.1 thioether cross-link-forming SCIFF peptide maturase [Desulfallas sp. Bu1-1]